MSEAGEATAKRPKGRSPSYPAINLETATRRAQELWDKERQYPASVFTVADHWSYKSLNGPASLTVAALLKFGLVSDEGSGKERRIKLTDLAVDLLRNPADDVRASARKDAALRPSIHREMWEKYGNRLPSDANLQWELTREKGFTETGAKEFLRQYRETLRFADIRDGGGTIASELTDTDGEDDMIQEEGATLTIDPYNDQSTGPEQAPRTSPMRRDTNTGSRSEEEAATYSIPVANGRNVVVQGKFPITDREWEHLMAVLEAMKPGLIRSDDADAPGL